VLSAADRGEAYEWKPEGGGGAAVKTPKPPVASPTRPRFRPPADACDAHCHVFGPPERFPYDAQRPYTPAEPAPKERLAALHAHLGLSRAVIVQATPHGTDNAAMLDAIAASGGRYRGVALVPKDIDNRGLEALHDGGVRAARFNFVKHLGGAPDLAEFRRMVDRVKALGWHVELHFDAQDLGQYSALLLGLPVPFVIDHMGRVHSAGGAALDALLRLLAHERAHVKISGAERVSASGRRPFDDAIAVARRIVAAAPDRVVWGTDWPHPNVPHDMPDDGELVDLFARMVEAPALQRRILVDNPTRLYWK
jgi:predicted TIM-barrel fold metal-dependent hydrolase